MINRIYQTVLFISNNELRGNVVAHEFNLALNKALLSIYDDYFFELNRFVTRENRGLVSNDFTQLPDYLREKIKHYLTNTQLAPVSSVFNENEYELPLDLRFLDVSYVESSELEYMTNPRQYNAVKKNNLILTEYYVALLYGNKLKVTMNTSNPLANLDLWYLRTPKQPKWTYTKFNNNEIFNPAAPDFQDVDMHKSEEVNLIKHVLYQFGINLKEPDIVNYMMSDENKEFQQENTN